MAAPTRSRPRYTKRLRDATWITASTQVGSVAFALDRAFHTRIPPRWRCANGPGRIVLDCDSKSEQPVRALYVIGLSYIAVSAYALLRGPLPPPDIAHYVLANPATDAGQWFRQVKPYCNTLEVETIHRHRPPPSSLEGVGFSAACWALAGRIDEARSQILTLPGNEQWKAAGIVFEIGHPIADMGDDRSAGPIMELVIEFWPNHYMALYHAGAARFALGEFASATWHLKEFLRYYQQNDGWTRSAKSMLKEIGNR